VRASQVTAHLSRRSALAALASALCWPGAARAGGSRRSRQTVRIAFIDPLSGPMADVGRNGLLSWRFMAEALSGPVGGGAPRFLVAGFDNKGSPQESLNALKAAVDQGFRYIVQGNGSGVAAAISEALMRHNLRHPQQPVVQINYAAMDPALTTDKCSPWHVRIDADTAMKTLALARHMADLPGLQRVYLLNQNYAHGQQFSLHFKQALRQFRPDIQVVGDEMHPPFQGRRFDPYVKNLMASGAQALVTANWGADLTDMVRSLGSAGSSAALFAYYPSLPGVPTALAQAGNRFPVYQVACSHTNQPGPAGELAQQFRAQHGEDFVVYAAFDGIAMLRHAITQAATTEPAPIAARLSGMIFPGFNGPVQLRADDHQLQKGVYIARWQPVSAAHPRPAEGTGHTFAPLRYFDPWSIRVAARCEMPQR
jgi:branched-chain amino acid transport system substrate-binding protein